MKILVAVDGSEYTRKMVAYWAAHDDWLGPAHEYTVLTVVPPIPARAAAMLDREVVQGYYADEGEAVFHNIRDFLSKQGVKATYLSKTGRVAEVIAKTAMDEKFDLIVMGSHGHSRLGGVVLGSVTSSVLAGCRIPVLIIR